MRQAIGNVMAMGILLVMAAWVMSASVSAQETATARQGDEVAVAPSMEINKEAAEQTSSDVRDDRIASEFSQDVEQPMNAPDSESLPAMSDRRALCGPWKNAINHYACASGYDVY